MESIGEVQSDEELHHMINNANPDINGNEVINYTEFMGVMAEAEFYYLFMDTFEMLDVQKTGYVSAGSLDRALCGVCDLISDDRMSIIDTEDMDMQIDYETFADMLLGKPLTSTTCFRSAIPKGLSLLLILEQIEVGHPGDERQSYSKPAKAQGAEQPSKKFALGARIPKKPKQARTEYTHVDKNCKQCKKHGGAHTMHNTAECCCFNKDRTPTRGTFAQAAQKSHEDSRPKKFYTQALARMEKLEKSLKKANKKGKKRLPS
eukprot:CCRYP_009932-RA/>CCRYP_009932-RA protein AED:0.30 eAED:0.30 QI:0/0/0/1/1/1/2/0/261